MVAADPDQIRFQVAVDDVLAPALTVVVVEAVDDNDAAIVDLTGPKPMNVASALNATRVWLISYSLRPASSPWKMAS